MSSTCSWTSSSRTTSCLTAAPPFQRTSMDSKEFLVNGDFLSVWGFTGRPTGILFFFSAWFRTYGPSWRRPWPGRGTRRTSLSGWCRAGVRGFTERLWQRIPTSTLPARRGSSASSCSLCLESPKPTAHCCGWHGSDWHDLTLKISETWSGKSATPAAHPTAGKPHICVHR